jgi:pyruvate-formate lyase
MDVRIRNMVFHHLSEVAMRPIKTAAVRRCVQGGYDDYSVPGMPKFSFWNTTGLVDTVDSLTAVKYCIYDKKMYTWDQLIEALKAEWKGYEDMQRDFKNAPKYGNDDDYADSVMVRFVNDLNAISHEPGGRDQDGGPVVPSGLIITSMFVCAPWTGALPNGRKRGEYLADGTLCPYAEFDKSGPWARSRSAQKIDQTKFKAWINNMKIEYPSVEGDAGLEKLVDFVDANMRGGNEQLQINFMSRDILRDAQEHPEKYPFLSVRISGWSAYFTALPKGMQDAVISRVDFKL